jgi:hypothetical protein
MGKNEEATQREEQGLPYVPERGCHILQTSPRRLQEIPPMIPVVRKYNLLSEKAAAKLIDEKATRFNYYARQGRGPESAFIAPDGRRYYERVTLRAWRKPPRKGTTA